MHIPLPIIGVLVILSGRWRGIRFNILERWKKFGRGGLRYEQHPANATRSVLLLGDSTVYGIGASRPETTVAGWLGQMFPHVQIVNRSRGGFRFHELSSLLTDLPPARFNAVVVIAGGNDVLFGTQPDRLEQALTGLIRRLQTLTKHVILVNQGNIGNVPILPGWLRPLFTRRSQILRHTLDAIRGRIPVGWVDFYFDAEQDHWGRNVNQYYSLDGFHPGDQGYREWAEHIATALRPVLD